VFGLAVMASPLSVNAQAVDEGTEPTVEEPASAQPAPSTEGAPEEPALQLKLDDAGVEVVPSPPRTYTIEEISKIKEMERRVKRAKVGLGVSAGVLGVGLLVGLTAGMAAALCGWGEDEPSCPPPGLAPVGATGAVLGVGGLAGTIASGVMLRKRKRKLRRLREAHYHRTSDAVEVDRSDDAFLVIVTRKYDGGQLTGASVFIRHTDSGREASPSVDAVEIDTLEQVIREHKAKLLSGE